MGKIYATDDPRLSFGAMGILFFLLESGTPPTVNAVTPHGPSSKHMVRKWLNELVAAGYVKRTRRSIGGRFQWAFEICDSVEAEDAI